MERMGWQLNIFLQAVFVVIIIALRTMPSHASPCNFDDIKLKKSDLGRSTVSYGVDRNQSESGRVKRSLDDDDEDDDEEEDEDKDPFHPIRISVQFFQLEQSLNTRERERLKRIVNSALDKVKNIFKVVPVQGPLLLSRSSARACKVVVGDGKCTQLKPSYAGEYCLDKFHVPDNHLDGFYLWNQTDSTFREVHSPGRGIPDSDYILYVRSLATPMCVEQGPNTIAYAAYCQVDQNDRPIAGYINLCPDLIKDSSYNEHKIERTVLHEMFHALGFASELFPKFKMCNVTGSGMDCTDQENTVEDDAVGAVRLITPNVIKLAAKHFNCHNQGTVNDFGPVLQTENGVVKSHWDAAFMHGSLMTPNIGPPHLSLIDPMTLAVFEDSGWYRVNYDYADTFRWGKGGGCDFGLNPSCEMSKKPYFCSGSAAGCHFLQFDKGRCETDQSLHKCRLFKTLPNHGMCFDFQNAPPAMNLLDSGEVYGWESRCFVSNASLPSIGAQSSPMVGRCLLHLCNATGLYVKVGHSPYCPCPYGELILIPGYQGQVQCPPRGIMCTGDELLPMTTPRPNLPPTTPQHPVRNDPSGVICIDIIYTSSNVDLTSTKLILFQNCNLDTILFWTRISRRRLENFYVLEESLVFRFNLLPMRYSNDGPPSAEVFRLLQDVVRNKSFQFYLPPRGPTFIASDIARMDGPRLKTNETPIVVIVGAAIGAVCGAIVLGILIFLIQRHFALKNERQANRANHHRTDSRNSNQTRGGARSAPNTPRSNNSERPEPPRWTEGSRSQRSKWSNNDRPHEAQMSNGHHINRPSISSEGDVHLTINIPGNTCKGQNHASKSDTSGTESELHGVTLVI